MAANDLAEVLSFLVVLGCMSVAVALYHGELLKVRRLTKAKQEADRDRLRKANAALLDDFAATARELEHAKNMSDYFYRLNNENRQSAAETSSVLNRIRELVQQPPCPSTLDPRDEDARSD